MRSRLPALLVLMLSGCAASNSAETPLAPCEPPVTLPDRALSDRDIEILWGRDRDALRTCGERLAALTKD